MSIYASLTKQSSTVQRRPVGLQQAAATVMTIALGVLPLICSSALAGSATGQASAHIIAPENIGTVRERSVLSLNNIRPGGRGGTITVTPDSNVALDSGAQRRWMRTSSDSAARLDVPTGGGFAVTVEHEVIATTPDGATLTVQPYTRTATRQAGDKVEVGAVILLPGDQAGGRYRGEFGVSVEYN